MCVAALTSLTEVKVWRGRALVRRNTAYESAFWYAGQVAKLTVPLSYNFMTFLSPEVYTKTTFYHFLGKLINLTPLGEWFDFLFPMFILVPVCATLFNLYGRVKRLIGYGGIIEDEDEDNPTGYGTGSWREGRDLIERELNGQSALGHHGASLESHTRTRPAAVTTPSDRIALSSSPVSAAPRTSATVRPNADPQQRRVEPEEDETFLGSFGHRFRNTVDTFQTPKWLQNVAKKPKWIASEGTASEGAPARSGSSFTRLFGGSQEGRVRL